MISFRMLVFLALFFCDGLSHPASCTDDSHCPSGFYCEERAYFCQQCLRCSDLHREPPVPKDICVKSATQCGVCAKGLVTGNDSLDEACASPSAVDGGPAYLPAYAWAILAIGLLLMFIILNMFVKLKAFKVVAFSSSTSVQSRSAESTPACQLLAPPPYNYLSSTFPPTSAYAANAPDIQQLIESSGSRKHTSPEKPPERPRESSTSQAARVCNYPTYEPVPQNTSRSNTPERAASPSAGGEMTFAVLPPLAADRHEEDIPENNNLKLDSRYITNKFPEYEIKQADGANGKRDQHSNSKQPSPEGNPSGDSSSESGARRDAYFIGGPSFVINVVESINTVRQRNEAHFS